MRIKSGLELLIVLIFFTNGNCWIWTCNDGACTRRSGIAENKNDSSYQTLEICRLVCSLDGNVWPQPKNYSVLDKRLVMIDPEQVRFTIRTRSSMAFDFLNKTATYFTNTLLKNTRESRNCKEKLFGIKIHLDAVSDVIKLTASTNEEYFLRSNVDEINQHLSVNISAPTIFGVRHGLETLLQLIASFKNRNNTCFVSLRSFSIDDGPTFKHRGLLLDTGRNFLSIETIKNNIVAMAMCKLNVLHWHITDSQSFPFESTSLPNMTRFGAYDKKSIYKPREITELVEFAKLHGVRIIFEIDGPAHIGNGWQWGPDAGLGTLALCVNQQPWRSFCIEPPCGQLNVANSNIYKVLWMLYKDITNILPESDTFHMGGDEVFIPCWNSSKEILDYIWPKPPSMETFLDLWSEYHRKALEQYDNAKGDDKDTIVVWSSHLTNTSVIEKYLSKERYVIQTWVPDTDDLPKALIKLGYRVILSTKNRWYLDHGFWGSTQYYNWRTVYDNKIINNQAVLGGEVCMWGEYVDDANIMPRIWPRAAAAAERLWTNPPTGSTQAQNRFLVHRERLVHRGIDAETVITKWCVQNENQCF